MPSLYDLEAQTEAHADQSQPAPAAFAHNATPPVDLARLLDVCGEDEAEVRELIALYLEQTTADLARLGAAISAHDAAAVRRIAHTCVGSSATCGMDALVAPLRALEQAGAAEQIVETAPLFVAAERAFARIKNFLAGQYA